jgi:hypothetical protein
MEQIMEAVKFLFFYGMQAFAIGLVVGIGVIATLYELVRDNTHKRCVAPPNRTHEPAKRFQTVGRSLRPTAPCGDPCNSLHLSIFVAANLISLTILTSRIVADDPMAGLAALANEPRARCS